MPELRLYFKTPAAAERFTTQVAQVRHALNCSEEDAVRTITSIGSKLINLSPALVKEALDDLTL